MHVQTETKPYDSINVTPMLDLAYVLLVIFIIMTTASVQGLSINLPKPSNKPSTEKKEFRIVQVTASGQLLLNGAAITAAELEGRLAAARARDAEVSVVIKGDPETQYARVVEVIDITGRVGIANVGLVTARIGT
ncbi:MAG: biopolymer transporter ExbD [Rhodocyclaceae bacterium]|nr:biopolymer transporter ExbD [Rhodocyclaceae bacterium]